jgi:hypothetical protein
VRSETETLVVSICEGRRPRSPAQPLAMGPTSKPFTIVGERAIGLDMSAGVAHEVFASGALNMPLGNVHTSGLNSSSRERPLQVAV